MLMNVPKKLNDAIKERMDDLVDDISIPENFGSCIDAQTEEINHEGYDGFIPYTNGGYRLTLLTDLASASGSGSLPSNPIAEQAIQGYIDQSYKDSLLQFIDDNKDKLQAIYPDKNFDASYTDSYDKLYELCSYSDLYDDGHGTIAEQLSEYEYEWMSEGGTFAYQFTVMFYSKDNFRNESGKDELYFFCGVNTDFEYIRDNGLICTYENNVPLKGLTIATINKQFDNMIESI